MKLGLLINSDRHLEHVIGVTRAATDQGHEVIIFSMDDGTRLMGYTEFTELCLLEGVTMSFCRHSAEEAGVETGALSREIVSGSQFNNALMSHEADRVLVF
ncbi:MAG: hypothetical protein JSW10_02350 [Pseudomonadota bacterium]|nr:MAG: hypothetical protein JSW10_02350 [Pseudomonadota bacterium]